MSFYAREMRAMEADVKIPVKWSCLIRDEFRWSGLPANLSNAVYGSRDRRDRINRHISKERWSETSRVAYMARDLPFHYYGVIATCSLRCMENSRKWPLLIFLGLLWSRPWAFVSLAFTLETSGSFLNLVHSLKNEHGQGVNSTQKSYFS